MKPEDLLKPFSPERLRPALYVAALLIIARAVTTLDSAFARSLLEFGNYQPVFDQVGLKLPRAVMTVMWPLAFAFANGLQPGTRVVPSIFFLTIGTHLMSVCWAAYNIATLPIETIPIAHSTPDMALRQVFHWRSLELACLAIVTSAISILWYLSRRTVFSARPTEDNKMASNDDQALRDEGSAYFAQLLTEYKLLGPQPADHPARKTILEVLGRLDRGSPAFGDIYALERSLLELHPVEFLRRKAWSLRSEYRSIAGKERYEKYLASNPPDAATAAEDALRKDLTQLLGEVQWCYILARARTGLQRRLAVHALAGMSIPLILISATLAYWALDPDSHQLWTVAFVAPAGALGAFVSVLRRIQGMPLEQTESTNLLSPLPGEWSLLVAPLTGMIAATLLYLLFLSDLVSGDLFPNLHAPANTTIDSFGKFLIETGPHKDADFAKALVWGFIAGFSERFVPDLVDSITNRAPKPNTDQ